MRASAKMFTVEVLLSLLLLYLGDGSSQRIDYPNYYQYPNRPINPVNMNGMHSNWYPSYPFQREQYFSGQQPLQNQFGSYEHHPHLQHQRPPFSSQPPRLHPMAPGSGYINPQQNQRHFGIEAPTNGMHNEPSMKPNDGQSRHEGSNELPLFLHNAPAGAVEEYKRIIRQPNSTYETQIQKIDKLVEGLDEQAQIRYKEFMRENDERERTNREKVHKSVSEMSENAQQEFSKISAILRNQEEPNKVRWDHVLKIYAKMDPELRDEFEEKFKNFNVK